MLHLRVPLGLPALSSFAQTEAQCKTRLCNSSQSVCAMESRITSAGAPGGVVCLRFPPPAQAQIRTRSVARGRVPGRGAVRTRLWGGLAQCLSPQGLQRRATPHPSELKVMKKVIEVRRSEAHAARPDADPKSPNADVSAVHQKGVTENTWLSRGTGQRELGRDDSPWERPGPSWDCRTPGPGSALWCQLGPGERQKERPGPRERREGICVQCSPLCRNAREQRRFWSPHEERWEQSAGAAR